jgi:PAS domain S-box-containing protein
MEAGKKTMQGAKTARQAKARILIVGEVPAFLNELQQKLDAEGYQAFTAVGFEQAVLSARQNQLVLVFLDILLAKKTFGRAMIEYFQEFLQTPLVYFDNRNGISPQMAQGQSESSPGILRKFDPPFLRAAIESALQQKQRFNAGLISHEKMLGSLSAVMNEAVVMTDALGRVNFINPAAARLTGWDEQTVKGRQLGEVVLLTEEKTGRILDVVLQRENKEKGVFGGPRRTLLKSRLGQDYLVSGHYTPVLDEAGQLLGTIWSLHDVSGRLETEDRLFQKSFELQMICGAFPDYYFRLAADGTILEGIGGKIWGTEGPADVVEGKKIQDAFPSPVREQFHEALLRMRKSRAAVCLSFSLVSAEGERNFDARLIPSLENQVLYIVRDITENRQAQLALRQIEEQLRQAHKMEAIGKLAGGVAHDFNNLLTAIAGYSDILLKRLPADSPLRHEVTEIKQAGERASQLTRQLLAFSRKQVLAPKLLDMNLVVENMNTMLRRLIGEHIELVTHVDKDPAWVKTDPGQIEQVILNLVVNARDAMPRGGKIVIETSRVLLEKADSRKRLEIPPGPYVFLSVTDSGCGMDLATQAHLFEPYFTTKEHGKGTGLGLSTVYGIVKQSGGGILAFSEPGQGTRFEVYLPLNGQEAQLSESGGDSLDVQRGNETVLLVEDEEVIRRMVHAILLSSGYKVLQASRGREALQISREYQGLIHLMLTDVVMPEMSGYVLAEKLGKSRPEMRVIYMSGYSDETIRQHGEWDPEAPFIHKPFTPEGLNRKIRQVLDESPFPGE